MKSVNILACIIFKFQHKTILVTTVTVSDNLTH